MDDDDFFISNEGPIARSFRRGDVIVLGLDLAYGLSETFTGFLATARNLAGMHVNYQIQRERFHEEVVLEIETLVAGEENG